MELTGPTTRMAERSGRRRFVFPVRRLQVEDEWVVGPATIRPAGALIRLLEQTPRPSGVGAQLYDFALQEAAAHAEHATIEVLGTDQEPAAARAMEVMRLLRLFQRTRYEMVWLRHQAFGIPGELTEVQRAAVVLGDHPTVHWHKIGNLAGWEFNAADVADFAQDERFTYLADAVAVRTSQRLALARRALLALEIIDASWLTVDPRVDVLFLAMAVEVLLGGRRSDTLEVARRAAYLTCPARCGRDQPACRYIYGFSTAEAVIDFIRERRADGEHGLCSAFLNIAWELAEDRNRIVHQGAAVRDWHTVAGHHSNVDRLFLAALEWFARNPRAQIAALNRELNDSLDSVVISEVEEAEGRRRAARDVTRPSGRRSQFRGPTQLP